MPRAIAQRGRQFKAIRISGSCDFFQRRPSRKSEPHHFCRFVESLTGRIVHGRAQALIAADILRDQQLCVPTRHQKQQIRKRQRLRQARRQGVALKMIHGDQRLAGTQGQSFCRHQGRHHPANQAGP